ncbi:DUF6565 domain-containing protein [Rufibacter roseus]|uniref:DUF6565 domain-containing protein n=1 Tax=Rufibacter roseus TaxID=1567108 RepID=A0ABW2DS94_9BACT|nr:DUF6565 domain-containing protein [Rufibacter roseus]
MNLFKKHSIVYLAAFLMAFGQIACSRTETGETAMTSDQAFEDYRSHVTAFEQDVNRGWDSTTTDANAQMEQWRTDYDTRRNAVAQYEGEFDERRRQEYEELQTRYNNAWNTREQQYNTWRQNNQSAGMSTVDMSMMDETKVSSFSSARDIREAYEAFVAHVEANKNNYTNDDWKVVENYWNELDDRKNALQSQLTDKDKWEIAKAKTKYITMKNASKAGNTAGNVGSNLKETGKDVKGGVKDAGKAVGNSAEKAGKAVGNTAEKAANKVENVIDDDKN